MRKINMWFIRNFMIISQQEAKNIGLKFWRNVSGDERNHTTALSIWIDAKGREYQVSESVYTGGGFEMY